jgi:hypothetical protein
MLVRVLGCSLPTRKAGGVVLIGSPVNLRAQE